MNVTLGRIIRWIVAAAATIGFVYAIGRLAIQPAAEAATPPEAGAAGLRDVLFYAMAALTIGGAAGVALSRNILYSAIGLLSALLGAGALYVFLAADFLAVTQLLVYIGGVLVLVLFAVMLTNRITDVNVSNASFGLFGGFLLFVAAAPVLLAVALATPWAARAPAALAHTTEAIGDGFLTTWLLPFEVASMVLLATLIGAVVIARKEIKAD
ncbi:MAG TPA: NADH-quinone oxidoreductase subunit J [Anaeromyxobacteraceae bacterium]|nr:NADH-quinone oxidoreductase subunit J [Anaeromyxobacteraceae bacterium]